MGSIVGNVGGMLGMGGGSSTGVGFQAQGANLLDPTNQGQLTDAYTAAQSGLSQQQQLASALAAQNGIQNQSNVYNQLQGVANGQGPNPAMAQLAQTTGANTANQAALMAGQRGSGANVGLLARQAAMQGAANQQNAVGQGATMQANQSLNALGQLGGIAGQQVAQQQTAVQGVNANNLAEQQALLNANQGYNTNQVSMQSNLNTVNQAQAAANAKSASGGLGGLLNAAGTIGGSMFGGSLGGMIGGAVGSAISGGNSSNPGQGQTMMVDAGKAKGGLIENPKIAQVPVKDRFSGALAPHLAHVAAIYHPDYFSGGGKVNAMVSPGEGYLPPEKAKAVAAGKANPMKEADRIPGKALVKGDSSKNDVVPAKLEEGGIVIPRSVMQAKDPSTAAAKFVEAHIKKHGSGNEEGDFKSALKKAISNRKSSN